MASSSSSSAPRDHHQKQQQIGSSAISVRPFRLSDLDDYMEMQSDPRFHTYFDSQPILDRQPALAYFKHHFLPNPTTDKAVCLHDRPVGYIYFSQRQPQQGEDEDAHSWTGEVGYALSPAYWGKGITTAALRMAVSDFFREFEELLVITAHIALSNIGSQRVAEKVGFRRQIAAFEQEVTFLIEGLLCAVACLLTVAAAIAGCPHILMHPAIHLVQTGLELKLNTVLLLAFENILTIY